MIKNNKILAIIPARSGSKGLKNKNLKKLGSHPLVAWPINSAKKSQYIDRILVSTDSKKIAKIAKKYGAEAPFLRPKKLSTDKSPSFDLVKHCLNFLRIKKETFDYICLLEPTSPFTSYKDIDKSIKFLINNKLLFNSLVGVYPAINNHIEFIYTINKKNKLKKIQKGKNKHFRRQDIKKYFYLDGSIYISKTNILLKEKTFVGKKTLGYVMPKIKSFEIDDKIDFILAKKILEIIGKNEYKF